MSIRIAIAGAGVMGADHASIVANELSGCTLQVICDPDVQRATAIAQDCDAVDVMSDPERAITRDDVDAVIIASPDFTHTPLTLAALDAGKPVLCEKPLSQSSDECIKVMERERAIGERRVMLGFMRRYDQSYKEMRQALNENRLGRALMMHNFHRNVETPAADFTGAMAISNSAPHEFDVVRHVLDTEYTAINAFQPKRSDDVVAPVMMVLETTDQQLVTIEINNNAAYGYDVRAELVGERSSIAINPVAYTRMDSGLGSATRYGTDWRDRYHEAYVRQNRDFIKFIESGVFPTIAADCWDGYCATKVAEAGVQALAAGTRQSIEMIEKPDLYHSQKGHTV